jgi:hypothetical protein
MELTEKDKAYALRVPRALWDELAAEAAEHKTSVNALINLLLAGSLDHRYEISVKRIER